MSTQTTSVSQKDDSQLRQKTMIARHYDRLERIWRQTGSPVALVGHSRGGHFAKALAHRRPDRVSAVVSMGAGLDTPFDISFPTQGAIAMVRGVHNATDPKMSARSR